MGVTYKLKKEIVDFLVNEKKANPQLGCRNLVNIVEQKFQIKISKSSINSIIKEAQLSSSVGRKPLFVDRKQSKFKIPDDKKSQLFPLSKRHEVLIVPKPLLNNAPAFLLPQTDDSLLIELPSVKQNSQSPCPPICDSTGRRADSVDETNGRLGVGKEKINQPPHRQASTMAARSLDEISKNDKGILHDAIGCFFLKAAEWELGKTPILGKMLAKHIVSGSAPDIDMMSDLLLFLSMFGINQLEEIEKYQGSGLWAIHGLKQAIEYSKIVQYIENINDLRNLALRMSNEIPQIFFEGKYIKIFLEDKSEIILDPQYKSLWKDEVQSFYSASLQKVILDITKKIITNFQSVILHNVSEQTKFLAPFYNMVAAFEHIPGKKIVKVVLFDENDLDIAEFTAIPIKKRFFIAGGCMRQKEIQDLYNEKLHFEPFWNNIKEKALEFCEQEVVFKKTMLFPDEILLRAIFFREGGSKDSIPSVVMTNIPKVDKSAQEIIMEFLKRWPAFLDKQSTFGEIFDKNFYENTKIGSHFYEDSLKEQGKSFLTGEIPSIWDNIHVVLCALNRHCQRHFFPPEYSRQDISVMKSRFYQLPGYLVRGEHFLSISLKLSEDYVYKQDLEFAIKRLNEREILDPTGLRLFAFVAER